MNNVLSGYEPQPVFDYFQAISAIPRGSGNETEISAYLVAFAKEHGLWVHQDEIGNVLIKKPATCGCENQPAVAFQGHVDMVCEKNADSPHDFLHDPISLIAKDGWVRARGTTLGADNGIAVAMMMALLTDKQLRHPALECIFTVSEEIGLEGATAFDGSLLDAKYMINLDSEAEGVATVSCCGGVRAYLSAPLAYEAGKGTAVELFVHGLAGGHSGVDISKNRANALKIMAGLLHFLRDEFSFALASMEGGNKDNAIPRECKAVIVTETPADTITAWVKQYMAALPELSGDDNGLDITVSAAISAEKALSGNLTDNILTFIHEAPNGVLSRFAHDESLVETSCNLASISTDVDEWRAVVSIRSAAKHNRDRVMMPLRALAQKTGLTLQATGEYPGWDYEPESYLREVMGGCYRALYGKELKYEAIHAGLECGIFKSKCPQLDIIAIGPNIADCHTPAERLDLVSCQKVWELVVKVLDALC